MAYKYNPLLKNGLQEVTASDAVSTTYDNSGSGLAATNAQSAIDELNTKIDTPAYVYWTSVFYNYQSFLQTKQTVVTRAYDPNLLVAYPVHIKQRCKIDQVSIFITVGAAGAMVIGLYDQAANGLPGNLLFQTTAFNTAIAPSQQSINLASTQIIEPGIYYVTYNCNAVVTGAAITTNGSLLEIGQTIFSAYTSLLFKAFTYTGTLPASFGGGISYSTTTTMNLSLFRTIL